MSNGVKMVMRSLGAVCHWTRSSGAFVSGQSAESIAQAFPVLTLEQVYGAITFSLAHRDEIDRSLEQRRRVLALAARDARVLVTHDHRTMPRFLGDFMRTSSSPGLTVVPQILSVRDAADVLILIWAVTKPEDRVNRVASLPI